jgi:hypothetical protein
VADLVRRTGAGAVLDRNDLDGIATALMGWVEERRRTGRVRFPGDVAQVEELSRRGRTRLLARVFDEVVPERVR